MKLRCGIGPGEKRTRANWQSMQRTLGAWAAAAETAAACFAPPPPKQVPRAVLDLSGFEKAAARLPEPVDLVLPFPNLAERFFCV